MKAHRSFSPSQPSFLSQIQSSPSPVDSKRQFCQSTKSMKSANTFFTDHPSFPTISPPKQIKDNLSLNKSAHVLPVVASSPQFASKDSLFRRKSIVLFKVDDNLAAKVRLSTLIKDDQNRSYVDFPWLREPKTHFEGDQIASPKEKSDKFEKKLSYRLLSLFMVKKSSRKLQMQRDRELSLTRKFKKNVFFRNNTTANLEIETPEEPELVSKNEPTAFNLKDLKINKLYVKDFAKQYLKTYEKRAGLDSPKIGNKPVRIHFKMNESKLNSKSGENNILVVENPPALFRVSRTEL